MQTQLNVAIDVGSVMHRVAIGLGTGAAIDEFDCPHTSVGIAYRGQVFHCHIHYLTNCSCACTNQLTS